MQVFSYKIALKRLFKSGKHNVFAQKSSCWIITEGLKGTENQCIGVAEALGLPFIVKQITLKQPWAFFSPYLGFEHAAIFSPRLTAPWPDILITSGRKSIAAARYIKKASAGKTFIVHIQDPKARIRDFDLIALPMHDHNRAANIITTLGAPNRITQDNLDDAREAFPNFKDINKPRVAVLIGGNSKAHRLSENSMRRLCTQLKQLGAGLMITASRRTGEANQALLREELKGTGPLIWDGEGDNPYFAMLAWADYILVTEDSVSMTSDAATTGKPTYTIPLEGGGGRLDTFHKNMQRAGITKIFEGHLDEWHYSALNDSQKIADEIKKRLED